MSRIGNRILEIPSSITITIEPSAVVIKNANDKLVVNYPSKLLNIKYEDNKLMVQRKDETNESNMFQGTVNANLSNAIQGLTKGFVVELELKGVGYRAKVEGQKINVSLGLSHPVILDIPQGIKIETPSQTEIKISGYDKQKVGQFAAEIRKWRKPEPYKGKGVLYKNEQIVRKVGKTADKKK